SSDVCSSDLADRHPVLAGRRGERGLATLRLAGQDGGGDDDLQQHDEPPQRETRSILSVTILRDVRVLPRRGCGLGEEGGVLGLSPARYRAGCCRVSWHLRNV